MNGQVAALFFEPLDVLTMRDGRPFDVGGIMHAGAVWPPSPWTVCGALRTLFCSVLGVSPLDYGAGEAPTEVVSLLGSPDGAPPFRLGPLLLARPGKQQEFLWPLPADVVTRSDGDKTRVERLRLVSRRKLEEYGSRFGPASGRDAVFLPPRRGRADKAPSLAAFRHQQLGAWLEGKNIPDPNGSGELPVATELRIGIAMDNAANRVREGMFYARTAHALAKNWRAVVPVLERGPAELPWEKLAGQTLRLGADGHLATVTWMAEWPLPPAAPCADEATLLFASPVRPSDLDALEQRDPPVRVRAVAAGKPAGIGGWQLRSNGGREAGPRPLRRYHPAGTVARVRCDGDPSALHGTSVAADPEERAAGFGFCLVGAAPKED